jgi:hypothetical protein
MKCRLCDRPTAAGSGKLCADCSKALKRARARAAALRSSPASLPYQLAAATNSASSSLASMSVPMPGWRRHAAWAGTGLVAIGLVYLGQDELDRRTAPNAVVVEGAPTSWTEPSKDDAQAASMLLEPPSSPTSTIPAPAAIKTGARTGTTSTNANRESKSPSPPPALAIETAANMVKGGPTSEAEASQILARASASPLAQTTDTGQSFASALEKCGTERLLSRFICEQKVYLQYCEDKWEKDPRCTRRTGSN